MSSVKQKKMKKSPQKSLLRDSMPLKFVVLDRDILGKMARQIKEKMSAHDMRVDTAESRRTSKAADQSASIKFAPTGVGLLGPQTDSHCSTNLTSTSHKSLRPENIPFPTASALEIQSGGLSPIKTVPKPVNTILNINNHTVARMASCLREKLKANECSDPFTSANCVDSTAITIPSPVPPVTKTCVDTMSELPILTYQRVGRRNTYMRPMNLNSDDDDEDSEDNATSMKANTREKDVKSVIQAPVLNRPSSVGLSATGKKTKSCVPPVISKRKIKPVMPVKAVASGKKNRSVKPLKQSTVTKPKVKDVAVRKTRSSR